MSVMLSASNCLDWICSITNTSIVECLQNIETYSEDLKLNLKFMLFFALFIR